MENSATTRSGERVRGRGRLVRILVPAVLVAVVGVGVLLLLRSGRRPSGSSGPPPAASVLVPGAGEKVLDLVPGDALAMYSYHPGASSEVFGQGLAQLLSAAGMLGMFGPDQQLLADVVSVVLEVSRYPHAVALLDIASRQLGPGSFRLDHFSAALIIDAGPDQAKLLALIKQIVDHYFTVASATIEWVGEGAARRQRLLAREMPEWSCWQWGRIGGLFVFTIGSDAYDRILAQGGVAGRATERLGDRRILLLADEDDANEMDRRVWLSYFDMAGLEAKLKPVLGSDYDRVIEALRLTARTKETARRVLLTAGYRDRAFITKLYLEWPRGVEVSPLTRGLHNDDPLCRLIPAGATSYAFSLARVSDGVAWATNTYLSSRNPRGQAKATANYDRIVREAGLADTYKQVFDHLGPTTLIHNWPPHPMNWPFARTLFVAHDHSPDLAANWPKAMAAWKKMLDLSNAPDEPGQTVSLTESLFKLDLSRTDDGIYFLHVGPIILAAGAMEKDFLVLSWSPPAVRANLDYLAKLRQPPTSSAATMFGP